MTRVTSINVSRLLRDLEAHGLDVVSPHREIHVELDHETQSLVVDILVRTDVLGKWLEALGFPAPTPRRYGAETVLTDPDGTRWHAMESSGRVHRYSVTVWARADIDEVGGPS